MSEACIENLINNTLGDVMYHLAHTEDFPE